MAPANDDEPRLGEHRLDQELGLVVQDDRARGAAPQGPEGRVARTPVEHRVAERSAALCAGLDEELAGRDEVSAVLAHERRERDGVAPGRRGEDVAEEIPSGEPQDPFARLDRDPHRAAAHQPGVPGELLGELVLAERGLARFDHALRFDERVTFDAAAAERSDQATKVVDEQLRPDHLGRAPGRPNDRRHRETAAFPLELGHPGVNLSHDPSIRRRPAALFPAGTLVCANGRWSSPAQRSPPAVGRAAAPFPDC